MARALPLVSSRRLFRPPLGSPASALSYVAWAQTKAVEAYFIVATEKVYSTTMDQATGKSVNGRNSYSVTGVILSRPTYERLVWDVPARSLLAA